MGSYNNSFVATCCRVADTSSTSISSASSFGSSIPSMHPFHFNYTFFNPTPHSYPMLHPKVPFPDSFKILQWNCNGLKNKLPEVTDFMFNNDIKIAAIQETKIPPVSSLKSFNGYNILRSDRGGGIAFVIHRDVFFSSASTLYN